MKAQGKLEQLPTGHTERADLDDLPRQLQLPEELKVEFVRRALAE